MTADHLILKKAKEYSDLSRGKWWRGIDASTGKIFTHWVDPNGDFLHLDSHHISPDGVVAPSVICSRCGFHGYLVLEGWKES